jgi:uncharacterized CHY-type Zn-finger protein
LCQQQSIKAEMRYYSELSLRSCASRSRIIAERSLCSAAANTYAVAAAALRPGKLKDIHRHKFVRSGKANHIAKRHEQHKKNALNDSTGSRFYACYPHRDSTIKHPNVQRGKFNDLVLVCGLAFDQTKSETASTLCSDQKTEGIFVWQDNIMEIICRSGGDTSTQDKQLDYVGYLTELVYDVMIAPGHNVSDAAGFEKPLGFFLLLGIV